MALPQTEACGLISILISAGPALGYNTKGVVYMFDCRNMSLAGGMSFFKSHCFTIQGENE